MKLFLLILTSVSLSCQIILGQHCDKEASCSEEKKCRHFDIENFNSNHPSIVYGEAAGRFGNQFLAYMVFHQLRQQLGMHTYINEECNTYAGYFFTPESLTMPILSREFCNPQDIISRLEPYDGPFKDLINDKSLHKGKLIHFYPPGKDDPLKGGYRPEDHISTEQEAFQKGYVKHLQTNMEFRDNLKERVNRRLKGIAKKVLGKKAKEVTYVGVHVRRTDHVAYMKSQHGTGALDAEYYNDAMEYFREEYDNCLFVVASDDIKWAKKNFDKSFKDLYFSDQNPEFHKDEYGNLQDNDMSKAAYDFALLTSCNHTIISRGTFSMFIALLTPGEYMTEYGVIVPDPQ